MVSNILAPPLVTEKSFYNDIKAFDIIVIK